MLSLSLLLRGVICIPGLVFATVLTKTNDPVDGGYIVTFKSQNRKLSESLSVESIREIIQGDDNGIGAQSHGTVEQVYDSTIAGFAAKLDATGLQNVLDNPDVESVEEDGYVQLDEATWGLDRIDDEDLPLDGTYEPTFGNNGQGVTAYIIDTGVLHTHKEFENRATQEFNSVGDGKNYDCHGHGTHVAGTVGSKTYGVANKAKIVGVKVLSCSGSGSWSGVIAGIDWVAKNANKPATANMSLGGGKNTALNAAVKALVASGVSTVVAAGNNNGDACQKSPASETDAITVGSTTKDDTRSSFSNWGTCVDIFAPGSSITAPWIGSSNTVLRTISGTSMASPHVCGAAALYLGQNRNLTPNELVEKMLKDSIADTISNVGNGSPNKFLYVAANQAPTVSPAPSKAITSAPTRAPTPGSDGYRIWALRNWIVRGDSVWDVRNVKFFPNSDCTGPLIRDGKAISSGYYPSDQWKPENAFGDNNGLGWGGRGSGNPWSIWLGMQFSSGREVKCVSFLDMSASSGTRAVAVQHKNKAGVWEDLKRLENLQPGQRHNIPLGRSCNKGRLLLEIDVTTGNKGSENTVAVRRMGKDGWVKRKSLYYKGFKDNANEKLTHCLHPDKCYKIAIKDRGNDGMTDGDGSYVIKVDGDVIKESEFESGKKEETLVNC